MIRLEKALHIGASPRRDNLENTNSYARRVQGTTVIYAAGTVMATGSDGTNSEHEFWQQTGRFSKADQAAFLVAKPSVCT